MGEELSVRSLFYDSPAFEHDDTVGTSCSRQSMRYRNGCPPARNAFECSGHANLGLCVDRTGRLIEHED